MRGISLNVLTGGDYSEFWEDAYSLMQLCMFPTTHPRCAKFNRWSGKRGKITGEFLVSSTDHYLGVNFINFVSENFQFLICADIRVNKDAGIMVSDCWINGATMATRPTISQV